MYPGLCDTILTDVFLGGYLREVLMTTMNVATMEKNKAEIVLNKVQIRVLEGKLAKIKTVTEK